jgi:O-antigen/teichoic acid export membrane protein
MNDLTDRLRSSIWTMGIQAAGTVLAFTSTWVLTQVMTPEGFGKFTVALAITSIVGLFGLRGLDQLSNRFIVEYSLNDDLQKASTFEWWVIRSTVMGTCAVSAITVAVTLLINRDWLIDSGFLSMLIGLPFMNYTMTCRGRLIARRRTIVGQMPEQVIRPLLIITIALCAWYATGGTITPLVAGTFVLAACVGMAAWHVVTCKPYRGKRESATTPGAWYRISIPLMASYGTFLLMNRTDLLLIAALIGDASAGTYAVAVRIAAVLRLPLFATQQVFSRDLVSAGQETRIEQLATAARRTCLIAGTTSLLGFAAVFVALPFVLRLFGPTYEAGMPVVWILGATHVFAAFLGPSGRLLGLNDGHRVMAGLILCATTINLALGWRSRFGASSLQPS